MAIPNYSSLLSQLSLPTSTSAGGGGGAGGLLSLLSGGPAAWGLGGGSLLFSLMQAGGERRRYEALQKRIRALLDPEAIYQRGITDFGRSVTSPAFGAAQRAIFGAGQGLERNITSGAARAGLNQSGIGIAARAGAKSTIGSNLGRLTADAWQQAMERAQSGNYQQASILSGMPRTNDWGQLSGVGINALLAYLLKRGGAEWPRS